MLSAPFFVLSVAVQTRLESLCVCACVLSAYTKHFTAMTVFNV